MKKWMVSVFTLCILLTTAGCGGENTASKSALTGEAEALDQVTVMLDWYPNAVHSYLYTAEEKGFFEEEGLEVEFQFPANPTDPLNLAASGKITMGMYYQPDVIMARQNENLPVKAVGAVVRSPLSSIVYHQEDDIQSPKDLKGKNIGYSGVPVAEKMIDTMIVHDGGDPAEVKMTDVGFDLMPAFVSEKTDAVTGMYINHEVPILKNDEHDIGVFKPEEYGVPPYYELVAVTSDGTWEKEQDQIEAFWRAAEKGFDYTLKNPDESLQILLDNQDESNFPLDPEIEKKSLEILLPKMESKQGFGSQNAESWSEMSEWLKDSGLIEQIPDEEDVFINISS